MVLLALSEMAAYSDALGLGPVIRLQCARLRLNLLGQTKVLLQNDNLLHWKYGRQDEN